MLNSVYLLSVTFNKDLIRGVQSFACDYICIYLFFLYKMANECRYNEDVPNKLETVFGNELKRGDM